MRELKKIGLVSKGKFCASMAILGVSLVIGLSLSGCGQKEPFRIGVLGTMSGSNSDLAVSGRRGLELAAAAINDSGGIKGRVIELIVKDDGNQPEKALAAIKEFQSEGIEIVIGPYTSGIALGVIDEINRLKLLTLAPTVSADVLSKKDDYFIRFIASTKEQAEVLSEIAMEKQHKKVAVVYDIRNKGFTDQLLSNYKALIQSKLQIEVQAMAYNPQVAEEIDSALKWIKAEKPEGLFIIASAEESAKIAQNIKQTLPTVQMYGPLWANTPELIHKGGKSVEGMIVVGGMDLTQSNEATESFRKEYLKQYGVESTFASVYSYEVLMSLRETIENLNRFDATSVRDKMIKIGKFKGLQQSYEIDEYGDNTRAYMIYEIKNSVLKKVE